MDINERKRNLRVKELMKKKNSPLVVSGDTGMKDWNVKRILSNTNEERSKLAFMNDILREERKDIYKKFNTTHR